MSCYTMLILCFLVMVCGASSTEVPDTCDGEVGCARGATMMQVQSSLLHVTSALSEEEEGLAAAKEHWKAENDFVAEAEADERSSNGLPAGESKFCAGTGVKATMTQEWFGKNYTWDVSVSDSTCNSVCLSLPEKCEEGGMYAASCLCVGLIEDADAACEGKADGEACEFDSQAISVNKTKAVGSKRKIVSYKKTQRNIYRSICYSREVGTLSCFPHRSLYCHSSKYNSETRKRTVTYLPPGSRCITNSGQTGSSSGSWNEYSRWTYSLSYCELKNTADEGEPNAETWCKSGYSPMVPGAEQP